MKCAENSFLLVLAAAVASSSDAFVTTTSPSHQTTTTALAGYHYTNGAEPDPSSMAPKNPPKKLQPVFPAYGTPEPKPALGEVGDASKKKGLKPVFLDWEDRGFSADGLQRQSS